MLHDTLDHGDAPPHKVWIQAAERFIRSFSSGQSLNTQTDGQMDRLTQQFKSTPRTLLQVGRVGGGVGWVELCEKKETT